MNKFLNSIWFHLRTGRIYVIKIWRKGDFWFVKVRFEVLDAMFNVILRWDGTTLQVMDAVHLGEGLDLIPKEGEASE